MELEVLLEDFFHINDFNVKKYTAKDGIIDSQKEKDDSILKIYKGFSGAGDNSKIVAALQNAHVA